MSLPTHSADPSASTSTTPPVARRQTLPRGLSTASSYQAPVEEAGDEKGAPQLPALTRTDSRLLAGSSGFCYEREEEPEVQLAQSGIGGSLQRQSTRKREPAERHPNDFDHARGELGAPIRGPQDHLETSVTRSASADRMDSNASSGKATVVMEEPDRRKSDARASFSESDDDDKTPTPIDLGDGKVALGKDAKTGKFVIIDKRYIEGGPYSKPRWRHSLPFIKLKHPPPPPKPLDQADMIPEISTNWWNTLTFNWISPLMALGAQRPLEAGDLWKMQPEREAKYMAQRLATIFQRKWDEAEAYNAKLEAGEIVAPRWKRIKWSVGLGGKGTAKEKETRWRVTEGKKKPSLFWTLSELFGWYFYIGSVYKVLGDTAQVTSPLIVKRIILFATEYNAAKAAGTKLPSVGYGIGMSIILAALLLIGSLGLNHFFLHAAGTGVHARAAIISALYERALRLTGRARIEHTNGKMVNHISVDVSRIDFACGFVSMAITSPIQFFVVVIILLVQIREAALVGIAFLLVFSPLQARVMRYLFSVRKKSMVWTDARIRLLSELLNGMKIVKLMAWELPFLERLGDIRVKEVSLVRSLLITRAGNMAVAMSLPILAAILSFITYAHRVPNLPAATLFTVITLFQLVRLPLMLFPMTLSAGTDAMQAIGRLEKVFMAETRTDKIEIDLDLDVGIKIDRASWTWDSAPQVDEDVIKKPPKAIAGEQIKNGRKGGKLGKPWRWIKNKRTGKIEVAIEQHAEIAAGEPGLQEVGEATATAHPGISEKEKPVEREIFQLHDINLSIPQGALVAVVGAIGSGKSSLLSGMVNEMRRLEGKVTFGGTTSMVPQTPWIVAATLRENILFGLPWDEEKYWWAVREACLEPDLDMLEDGDATAIGEKGINLSGGQKQRVSLARAFYYSADVMLFDDPLSAVDPGIAAGLWQSISRLKGKTRVIVTHALHFLPSADFIITLQDGRIAEQGTYAKLREQDGAFARLIKEFANEDAEEKKKEEEEEAMEDEVDHRPRALERSRMTANVEEARKLMQVEKMNIGGMKAAVYTGYMRAGKGMIMVPLLVLSVIVAQAFTLLTSFWLVWWQERRFPGRSDSFYEGVYSALGVGSAIFLFAMGATQGILSFFASVSLYRRATLRLLKAPMSFYDTNPLGRILNRMSKDSDTLDNTLPDSLRMLISTLANVLGAVILVGIIEPYFLIVVLCVAVVYVQLAQFYRKSALSFKRIDAILRSPLYAHFSESLSGLAVIRSYGETERFINENCRLMSIENRSYYPTVVNQRWLGLRLDFLGTCLTFSISLFVVLNRSISPAAGGLALSYMLTVQQSLSWLCRQYAEVENDLNSAERIIEYGTTLEQEAAHDIPATKPPASWPAEGRIEFKDVTMKYRPELPPALKNLSLSVGKAEKIGICGRTGAGKSTIMTTLYRIVELSSGQITVDDVDISTIGLTDLRQGLSIIPQEPLLFSGTIRSNLDPFNTKSDSELWDALRRAHLVDPVSSSNDEKSGTHTPTPGRFTLDTVIEDEGLNLSVGERSLVSLARALVRDAKIVVLDECTAAVDLETDSKIQETIRREFKDKTLLCIAHRIRTILSYDKILVMAAGSVAEFDTPRNLFMKEDGIFRSMCGKSNIALEDVDAAEKMR